MRTIVVGMQHGDMGEVLRQVTERATADEARVVVVHAYHDLARVWLCEDARSAVAPERRRTEATVAAAVIALRSCGVDAEHHVGVGRPAALLASVARKHEAEVIVIGSRRSRSPRRGRGGVARALDRAAPCPVVVIGEVRADDADARALHPSAPRPPTAVPGRWRTTAIG